MNKHDPEWARQSVSDAISNLRFLRNLKLIFPESVYYLPMNGLHLDRICNLENISVFGTCLDYHSLIVSEVAEAIAKSPLLAQLELDYPWGFSPPLDNFLEKRPPDMRSLSLSHVVIADVRYFFRVKPRLHALRSLELTNTAPSTRHLKFLVERRTVMTKFYKTLAHERTFLSRIVIDDVFPVFLDYLSLYSGILTEISILYLYKPVPWEDLDELAVRFYASILPKHIGSLEVLDISPMFTCKWCFHPKEYLLFSKAKHLRSLSVSFAFAHSANADPNLDHTLSDTVRDHYLVCDISY